METNIWKLLLTSNEEIEGTNLKSGMVSKMPNYLSKLNTVGCSTITYPITKAIEQLINGDISIARTNAGYHIECHYKEITIVLIYNNNSDLKVYGVEKDKLKSFNFYKNNYIHWSIFIPRIIELIDIKNSKYDKDFANDFYALLSTYKSSLIKKNKEIFRINDYIYSTRFDFLQRTTDILILDSEKFSVIKEDLTKDLLERNGSFKHVMDNSSNSVNIQEYEKFILDKNINKEDKQFIPTLDLKNIKISGKVYNLINMIKAEFNSCNKINNLLFYGPAGSGKSTAAKIIAQLLGLPYRFINLSLNTDEYHLTGEFVPSGKNEFNLTETQFIKTFRDGGIIELVELNYARPGVLGILNSALDDTQKITLPNGQTIERHPNCIIIATTNVGYAGCQQTNLSFIDRFQKIVKFDKMSDEDLFDIVLKDSGNSDQALIKKMIIVANKISEFVKENQIQSDICFTRQLINWARDVKYSKDPLVSARDTILPCISFEEEIQDEIYEQVLSVIF